MDSVFKSALKVAKNGLARILKGDGRDESGTAPKPDRPAPEKKLDMGAKTTTDKRGRKRVSYGFERMQNWNSQKRED